MGSGMVREQREDQYGLYGFSARTGKKIIHARLPYPIVASPAIGEKYVFAGMATDFSGNEESDSVAFGLSKKTGDIEKEYATGPDIMASPSLWAESIFWTSITLWDGELMKTSISAPDDINFQASTGRTYSSVSIDGKSVFVGTGNYRYKNDRNGVLSLSISTGERNWFHETDDTVHASPAVTDKVVYSLSSGGYLFGLNKETGKELWQMEIEGKNTISTPVITGGYLFVIDGKGTLLAIGEK